MKKLYYEIIETSEFGRGLYAYATYFKDEIVFDAELLILSPEDTKVVNTTDLKYYTFKYDETRDCLVLGDGEIFNHSDKPNVAYTLVEHEGRKIMRFTALRDIKDGEQMFIDYNADQRVEFQDYVGKNLLGKD